MFVYQPNIFTQDILNNLLVRMSIFQTYHQLLINYYLLPINY